VSKEGGTMQKAKRVMVSKGKHDVRRGELPFVRSFARSFVRLSEWREENDNGGKKSNYEGKKEQIKDEQNKKFL
jgi:hypothetical protein